MTPEYRQALKERIDAHVRSLVRWGLCSGCGCNMDLRTPGCQQCKQRYHARRTRERRAAA